MEQKGTIKSIKSIDRSWQIYRKPLFSDYDFINCKLIQQKVVFQEKTSVVKK